MLSNANFLNVYDVGNETCYGGKVHGVKRKFKVKSQNKPYTQNGNVSTFQNSYVGASANNQTNPVTMNIRLGDYKFPTRNKVKADFYFSRIDYINDSAKTKSGEPATEVFYTIIDRQICYKIAAGDIKGKVTNEAQHIRQLYPKGKSRYQALVDSVTESLGHPITQTSDFHGVTEWVKLEYSDYDYAIGGFVKRNPISWEEVKEYFKDLIQSRNMIMNSYVDDETTENDSNPNSSSECSDIETTNNKDRSDYDDYDDFLPDDDYWD